MIRLRIRRCSPTSPRLRRPARFAVSLRDEGRWSLLAGDTTNAVRAWTRYLELRAAPEPAVSAEVDQVRQSLARVRGAAARR